jgi:hypothetical protein
MIHRQSIVERGSSGFETVSLINAYPDDTWNAIKRRPAVRRRVKIEVPCDVPPREVLLASPDESPEAVAIPFEWENRKLRFLVPTLRLWALAIIIR